ncbi:hypothetical protein [Streptomyces sp. NRRL S-495]|uniref:hypothetical protein n=1 Tax=Streptomyces sp. NRRL S-495 TaxID=1609133 RepID=UPI00061E2FCF|nr:hypothetical protein [Streptomyces sp. NRRL S-495]KJY36775.1 hypothetical protein VR45_10550 [Streptomyces sp. NRRL S-495]
MQTVSGHFPVAPPRPTVPGFSSSRQPAGESSSAEPTPAAELARSQMSVVCTAPGAVVQEGFQKVDSSYRPRSAVKARRTGVGPTALDPREGHPSGPPRTRRRVLGARVLGGRAQAAGRYGCGKFCSSTSLVFALPPTFAVSVIDQIE